MGQTLWIRNLQLSIYGVPLSLAYTYIKDGRWTELQHLSALLYTLKRALYLWKIAPKVVHLPRCYQASVQIFQANRGFKC